MHSRLERWERKPGGGAPIAKSKMRQRMLRLAGVSGGSANTRSLDRAGSFASRRILLRSDDNLWDDHPPNHNLPDDNLSSWRGRTKTLGMKLHPSSAWACTGDSLRKRPMKVSKICSLWVAVGTVFSLPGFCQIDTFASLPSLPAPRNSISALAMSSEFDVSTLPAGTFDHDANGPAAAPDQDTERPGLVKRSVKRVLKDQEGIYRGPFKRSNFKWDALVLAGTTVLLIEDRHIENNLPGGHYTFYQATSDVGIAALGASLGVVWLYGIKTDNAHAKETGVLTLETLANTFLIYTPMQLIAARQRPGEGNGHGDFLRHSSINTSFPGGHAMFTYAMATIVSHEYSQKWVQVLAYTVASAVTVSRTMARDHWASDMFAGAALGIGIGAHVFHAHCDPDLSDSCKHHVRFIF